MQRFWLKVPLSCTALVRATDESTARRIVHEALATLTAQIGLAHVRARYDGVVIDLDFSIGDAELLRQKPRG
jgi:hypothetical protein